MPVISRTPIGLYLYIPPKEEMGETTAERLYYALRCGLYITPPKD